MHAVVFWGQRPPPVRPLRVQHATFRPHRVSLKALGLEAELARWRAWAAQGRAPPRQAGLELATLPRMRRALAMSGPHHGVRSGCASAAGQVLRTSPTCLAEVRAGSRFDRGLQLHPPWRYADARPVHDHQGAPQLTLPDLI